MWEIQEEKKTMAKKTKQPNREALENLAREMNEVMGLEPAIKISKKLDDEGLIEKIKEEAEGQIYASDFEEDPEDDEKVIFSEEAAETLKALGIEVVEDETSKDSEVEEEPEDSDDEEEIEEEKPAPKKGAKGKKEEPKKAAKGKKVDVEEEEEEEEEKPKKSAKGKGKKAEPEEEVEDEEEEVEDGEEKPAKKPSKGAKEAPKKAAKGKAKAEPKKAKKVKYTRSEALVDALKFFKKGATKKEIVEKSDELYVAQGGDSGMYVSEVMFRYTIPALLLLEHIELNDGKYKLV